MSRLLVFFEIFGCTRHSPNKFGSALVCTKISLSTRLLKTPLSRLLVYLSTRLLKIISIMTLHDFDNIRPFEPEELPEAFASLLSDEEFLQIAEQFFPNVRTEAFRQ